MADVVLMKQDAATGSLPDLCIYCGAAATLRGERILNGVSKRTRRAGLVGALVVNVVGEAAGAGAWAPPGAARSSLLGRNLTVRVPVCTEHQAERPRFTKGLIALLVSSSLFVAAAVVMAVLQTHGAYIGCAGAVGAVGLTTAFFWTEARDRNAIRMANFTDHTVTLTNVSEPFAAEIARRTAEAGARAAEALAQRRAETAAEVASAHSQAD